MKKTKLPSLVTIAIMTAITSLFWAGFSVYRVFTTKPSPKVPQEILDPVTPTLDRETIDKVQGKIFYEEVQIPQSLVSQTPVPSPTPQTAPTATPTATASATPATSSASPSP